MESREKTMSKELSNQKYFLEKQIGGNWIGIRFNSSPRSEVGAIDNPMRICEAILLAKKKNFILPNHQIDCMGGCRSIGCLANEDELVRHVTAATGLPIASIQKIVRNTPCLADIRSLEFGRNNRPDVWISYCTPRTAMSLVRFWQIRFAEDIPIEMSTFLATCGNVLAKSYLTNRICLSFGCPTSRDLGFIADDELVVGIPSQLLDSILMEE